MTMSDNVFTGWWSDVLLSRWTRDWLTASLPTFVPLCHSTWTLLQVLQLLTTIKAIHMHKWLSFCILALLLPRFDGLNPVPFHSILLHIFIFIIAACNHSLISPHTQSHAKPCNTSLLIRNFLHLIWAVGFFVWYILSRLAVPYFTATRIIKSVWLLQTNIEQCRRKLLARSTFVACVVSPRSAFGRHRLREECFTRKPICVPT